MRVSVFVSLFFSLDGDYRLTVEDLLGIKHINES